MYVEKDVQAIYPVSPMQEGMFYHWLYDENSTDFFKQMSYRLHGPLNIKYIEKSLLQLIKRHDILRTAFSHHSAKNVQQLVIKDRELDFIYEDISSQLDQDDFLQRYKEKDKQKAFNLTHDLLLRLAVFKLSDLEYDLTWSHHHIIMDGSCFSILMTEFFEIYSSFLLGTEPDLPPAQQYRSYIDWLGTHDRTISGAYWKDFLSRFDELASLPTILKNAPQQETKGLGYKKETIRHRLDPGKTSALADFVQQHDVTLETLFHTVWGIILARYNDCNDVVFGAVVPGRPAEVFAVQSIIGLFINTIPIRINGFDNDTGFLDLLKKVHHNENESKPHQYHSFAEIQANSSLKHMLLDHIIKFKNYPQVSEIGSGSQHLTLQLTNAETYEQINYDFNIFISKGKTLSIVFDYNGNLYHRELLERTAGYLFHLLDQVLTDENTQVNQLSLISPQEKQRLLVEFNQTRQEYPVRSICQLFDQQVNRNPEAVALLQAWDRKQWSYSQLQRKSQLIAGNLRKKGVTRGAVVGVLGERSIDVIAVILGILETGAAYLPIVSNYPPERIHYMLADSRAAQLVVSRALAQGISKIRQWQGDVSFTEDLLKPIPSHRPTASQPEHDDLAYVIYTSGSTGRPKGVMVEHQNVARLVKNSNYIQWHLDDSLLMTGNISFDVTTFEIWGPLLNGVRLCLADEHTVLDPDALEAAILDYNISILHLAPQLFEQLAARRMELFASLSTFMVGGDLVKPRTVNTLRRTHKHLNILHMYGPTENTTFSTFHPIHQEYPHNLPIGKPIANSTVYILDRNQRLQPISVAGELYTGGHGVARGYLNNPQLTAEKFVTVQRLLKKTLYRTGDLARWLPDGNIEFLGRIDNQVKLRGFRIELSEIENQLLHYEHIKDVIVILREDSLQDRYLCAYYVSDREIDMLQVKLYLLTFMPDYMVPTFFMKIPVVPVTGNGKLDRSALPAPEVKLSKAYMAPGNHLENQLVGIWSEVLDLDSQEFGVNSDFFQLGGHSLKVTLVAAKIHQDLDVKVPLSEIFKCRTIRELAQYIASKKEGHSAQAQKEYWLKQLPLPQLKLPYDFLPHPGLPPGISNREFLVDTAATDAVKIMCKHEAVTLYTMLLTLFKLFLSRITLQEDIVILTRNNGNSFLLRSQPAVEKSFSEFLQQVKQNTLDALENSDFPFEELHTHLSHPVEAVFRLAPSTSGLEKDVPLSLVASEKEEQILFSLQYRDALFKESTITDFVYYFRLILSSVLENPCKLLSAISIVSVEAKQWILYELNRTVYCPVSGTPHELFAEQAQRTPDNIALVPAITYRELNYKSDHVALLLKEKGVTPNTPVAIMAEAGSQMIIGILAILKAGGAYIPIEPHETKERISYILKDSNTKILLSTEADHQLPQNPEVYTVFNLDIICKRQVNPSPLTVEHSSRQLCCIRYKPGSSGPGILIEHHNLVRLFFNNTFELDFGNRDTWTLSHPYTHDLSIWEMFGSLLYGGKLVIVPPAVADNEKTFLQLVIKERITVLNLTPGAFYRFIEEESRSHEAATKLRYIVLIGEDILPPKLQTWRQRYPGTKLVTMYGTIETSSHATFREYSDVEMTPHSYNIGSSFPTLNTYVLDPHLKLVPVGVVGELCVSGEGVVRGYLNQVELTNQTFVNNPYKPGKKLFRSSRHVKLLESGEMEYRGLIKNEPRSGKE